MLNKILIKFFAIFIDLSIWTYIIVSVGELDIGYNISFTYNLIVFLAIIKIPALFIMIVSYMFLRYDLENSPSEKSRLAVKNVLKKPISEKSKLWAKISTPFEIIFFIYLGHLAIAVVWIIGFVLFYVMLFSHDELQKTYDYDKEIEGKVED